MLDFKELDHEFLTEGNPAADKENAAALIQNNLTEEEQNKLREMMPIVEQASALMYKAQTGQFPEDMEIMTPTNGQGVASNDMLASRVPQTEENESNTRSKPIEGNMPRITPKTMSLGGSPEESDIITLENIKNQPQWLKRALNPETKTLNKQTVRTAVDYHPDGNRVMLYPLIRQSGLQGALRKYDQRDAQNIALRKGDFIVVPSIESGNVLSKEISNSIRDARKMATGGMAAGPVGMVDAPGADESGVADDVPAKSDGFVINAAAVEHAGLKDIYNMIKEAVEYLNENGIDIDTEEVPVSAEDILVSNGEVIIPDIIARVIGYDKLEKINNRGKKETEEKLAAQEEGAPPEGPPPNTPPVLQDQMAGLT